MLTGTPHHAQPTCGNLLCPKVSQSWVNIRKTKPDCQALSKTIGTLLWRWRNSAPGRTLGDESPGPPANLQPLQRQRGPKQTEGLQGQERRSLVPSAGCCHQPWQGQVRTGLLGTRRTYCLSLVRVFSAGVPMTSWIFEIWSSSLAPGKRGCRLEERDRTVVRGGYGLFIPASPSAGWLAHMETQGHNPPHMVLLAAMGFPFSLRLRPVSPFPTGGCHSRRWPHSSLYTLGSPQ